MPCRRFVVLNALTRTALIVLPLTIVAARLHGPIAQGPVGVTQDLNRCLLLVRTAATRRNGQSKVGTKTVPTTMPERPEQYRLPEVLSEAA